jgi:arylsulfatase A-like enzyme
VRRKRTSPRSSGFAWLLILVAAWTASDPVRAADAANQPNFLFIISDDQRWDALGKAGNKAIHTPVLDRLAAEGVWFRQSTILVPQCSPTRSTLLTGLPPHQHRWYSNQYQDPAVQNPDGFRGLPTVPGLLQKAGYRTVLTGKWHPRPDPWNCGFTEVRVWLPGGGGPYRSPRLAHGPSRATNVHEGYTQEVFANDAIAFLRSDAATEKPFFFWLAFTAPHAPHQPNPERIAKLYATKTDADLLPPGFPRDAKTGPWKIYYEAVSHLDEQIGRLLRTLEERNLAGRTVVVFLGDNGYMMGERGWNGKVLPYEGSIRVPLIIRAPGIATIRGANDAPVSSLDLPPTFLKLAGVTPPAKWVGRDLTPLLRGDKEHGVREAVCEWADNQSMPFGHLGYRLIRTPAHKLIVWEKPDKPGELYDLVADAHEKNNLIDDAASARIRDDLRKRLQTWMEKTDDPARQWKK